MLVKTVLDPVLHQKARPVRDDEFGLDLDSYTKEMLATMRASRGVGLAAPQVGDSRRILVMVPGGRTYRMVNPVITSKSEDTSSMREGCLSVPGKELSVERPAAVTVEWRTPDGTPRSEDFTGFAATVVQHEIDHLDGITLVEKMGSFTRSRYLQKLRKKRKKLSR